MGNKTFTLHLTKDKIKNFEEVLSKNAVKKLADKTTKVFKNLNFGDGANLYIFSGFPSSPPWVKTLAGTLNVSIDILSSSACGILVFKKSGRIFASTFSYGWMYLSDRAFERDFGLRTAINALDGKKLKKLERTNLADALRGSALSPFKRDFTSFGIDDALELVRNISGQTQDKVSASTISGSASLKWSSELGLEDLPEIADEALDLFTSKAYKDTPFAIIDILKPVVDVDLMDELDLEVVKDIKNSSGGFELGMPIPSGNECSTYWFQGLTGRQTYEDLLVSNFIEAVGNQIKKLDVKELKDKKIVARYDDDGAKTSSCSVYSALVGSISYKNRLYALNEGLWYQVEAGFKKSIEEMFDSKVKDWKNAPAPFIRKAKPSGKGMHYEKESDYNENIAKVRGLYNLDGKLIPNPNFDKSRFEICDLLDLKKKKLIHVKKNSRQSSVLSHLFKQGSHSAQQLKYYPACLDEMRELLKTEFGNPVASEFDGVIGDSSKKWTVEFWIADAPRKDGKFNIPFFSKITLRDEIKRMEGLDYDVVLKFIKLPVPVIASNKKK